MCAPAGCCDVTREIFVANGGETTVTYIFSEDGTLWAKDLQGRPAYDFLARPDLDGWTWIADLSRW